jgi:hypothetical protein
MYCASVESDRCPVCVLMRQVGIPGEKAILRIRVGLDRPVTQNMSDSDTTFDEPPSDKQAAVASQRLVFAAHEREGGAGRDLFDLLDTFRKQWAARHQLVVGDALLWASSEFKSQEDVGEAGRVEAVLQGGAVEVRQPRSWVRSDVGDRADIGSIKQALESGPVMVGVPDAKYECHCFNAGLRQNTTMIGTQMHA